MPPLTTTLSPTMHLFLSQESKKIPRNKIIERGLRLYQKEQLKKSISEGFEERKKEYHSIQKDFQNIQSHSLLT